MSDMHSTTAPHRTGPAEHRDEFTLRIPKPGSGGGAARSAIKTTEFWMTLALVAFVLIATYADEDSLSRTDGWRYATWAVVAYVLSRGLTKLGNKSDADHDRNRGVNVG